MTDTWSSSSRSCEVMLALLQEDYAGVLAEDPCHSLELGSIRLVQDVKDDSVAGDAIADHICQ